MQNGARQPCLKQEELVPHAVPPERPARLPQSIQLAPKLPARDVRATFQMMQENKVLGTKQNGWRQPCLVQLDEAAAPVQVQARSLPARLPQSIQLAPKAKSRHLAPKAKSRDVMIKLQVLQKDMLTGTKQNGWRQPCLVLHDGPVRKCVDLLGADLVGT